MRTKWVSLSIGIGLLLCLIIMALFIYQRSVFVTPRPIVPSTMATTSSQKTSPLVPEGWQSLSNKTTGYTVFYPPRAKVSSFELFPGIIEQTQIDFPKTEQAYHMSIIIQIYDNSSNRSIETFLAELYQNKYGKPVTTENRQTLMKNTLSVAGTIGYQVDLLIGATERQVIIPHKNYFYMFILMHAAGPIDSSPGEIEIFNRFLATVSLN